VTVDPEPAVADPEKQLAWEKRHRFRAAIASILGAVGLLVFYVLQQVLQRDMPKVSGLETLVRAAQPGDVGALPSLQTAFFEYLDTKTLLVLLIGLGGFVGWIGVAWSVGFLGVATRARSPVFRKFIVYIPIVGGVVLAISVLMSQLGSLQVVSDFLDSDRTVKAATDADNSLIVYARLLYQLGTLALAVGLVLVTLNAMRVGLLTRMLGYIGIASGATSITAARAACGRLASMDRRAFFHASLGDIRRAPIMRSAAVRQPSSRSRWPNQVRRTSSACA